jgi:hypothetical protein
VPVQLRLAPAAPVAAAAAAAAAGCCFPLTPRHRLLLLQVRCLLVQRRKQQLRGVPVACQWLTQRMLVLQWLMCLAQHKPAAAAATAVRMHLLSLR